EKLDAVGIENCFISEITLAELKYGAFFSQQPEKHITEVEGLLKEIAVIPITSSIDLYAEEKARLRKAGTLIDDFDLLIGCTAIANGLTLVTNNTKHFNRLQNIRLEDWTK
ncbi:MAG: PIN domain-containing protein, partial [Phaeodactylibacter sp.]|nr:PIN domain-containing protein [Phaeodactylibacter sp.]